MRPRLALLLGALLVPLQVTTALVSAAPARAATNVICVNMPQDFACGPRPTTLALAIGVAQSDGVDSVIRVGPGEYTGPFVFDGSGSPLTVIGNNNGAGDNATVIKAPGATDPYASVDAATVRNLRIQLTGAAPVGLDLTANASAERVVIVDDASTTGAIGVRAAASRLLDSSVNLTRGSGATAFRQTVAATANLVSRATLRVASSGTAAEVVAGTLNIDNALVDLGAGQAGLRAGTALTAGAVAIDARQVTVVNGGAGSRGIWAEAGAGATSNIDVVNSIVRGPTHALSATGTGGAATLDVHNSDFPASPGGVEETGGGDVAPGPGNIDVEPGFIDPGGDYDLRAGAAVVDKGDASVLTAADRDGKTPRDADGDRNGSRIPDLGAYELVDVVAPKTVITAGPSGATNDNTPLFTFRSGPDARFECRIDASAYQPCTSPATTTPLPDGAHVFTVRATDLVFNVEADPPARKFTVDTVRPDTRLTKKAPHRFFRPKVRFAFTSSEPGAHFQCKLDRRAWHSCHSPLRYTVKVGKHALKVRAVDAAGNTDRTPATYTFRRLHRHR